MTTPYRRPTQPQKEEEAMTGVQPQRSNGLLTDRDGRLRAADILFLTPGGRW